MLKIMYLWIVVQLNILFEWQMMYLTLHLETTSQQAPVVQWVKRWPTDLAVVSSSTARFEDLFNRKRGSIAHSLSLSSAHRPDMTEILLKRT